MTHLGRLTLIGMLALPAAACEVITGSGEIDTETHPVSERHDEISVCCGFELQLEEGEPSLRIRADDNILDDIIVRDVGNRLTIEYDRPSVNYYPSRPVQVFARLKNVTEIEGSGGSSVEVDPIEADLLRVIFSGGSDGDFHDLDAAELRFQASGGSRTRLTGEVGAQNIDLSGGSIYEAFRLRSRSATVDASGGSAAELNVTEELDVEASGGSRVLYEGKPKVYREVSGGSTVKSVD